MNSFAFWAVWGKYYGYPQCCVNEMMHFQQTDKSRVFGYGQYIELTEGVRKFDGTGFIPCKSCNRKKIFQIQREINKIRICKREFPLQQALEQDVKDLIASKAFSKTEKKLILNQYKEYL